MSSYIQAMWRQHWCAPSQSWVSVTGPIDPSPSQLPACPVHLCSVCIPPHWPLCLSQASWNCLTWSEYWKIYSVKCSNGPDFLTTCLCLGLYWGNSRDSLVLLGQGWASGHWYRQCLLAKAHFQKLCLTEVVAVSCPPCSHELFLSTQTRGVCLRISWHVPGGFCQTLASMGFCVGGAWPCKRCLKHASSLKIVIYGPGMGA